MPSPNKYNVTAKHLRHVVIQRHSFTARKRSLGQGNVFIPVCHSVHRGKVSVPVCITGHMTGGPLSRGISVQRGVSVQGGLCPGGVSQRDTLTVTHGRYASYWNAFLCYSPFRLYSKYFTALFTKPAAEPFPASTGTIPVEWIKSLTP